MFVLAAVRRHPAAGRQPARRRAPEGSAGRPDPVGRRDRSWRGSRRCRAVLVAALALGGVRRLGRFGFYGVFALAVTASVQLVGVYLVFSSLIVPALATRALTRARAATCCAYGARRRRLCARAGAVGGARPAVRRGDRVGAGGLRRGRRAHAGARREGPRGGGVREAAGAALTERSIRALHIGLPARSNRSKRLSCPGPPAPLAGSCPSAG